MRNCKHCLPCHSDVETEFASKAVKCNRCWDCMVPAIMHDAEMIEHVQGYQAKYLIFSFQDAVEPAERLLVSIVEAIPKFGARLRPSDAVSESLCSAASRCPSRSYRY